MTHPLCNSTKQMNWENQKSQMKFHLTRMIAKILTISHVYY